MTAQERLLIEQLDRFVRQWQRMDSQWKEGFDERMRAVETYITTERALEEKEKTKTANRRLNRAQVITALGIAGSFVLGLLNHFT